jgi:hypothetical protein
MVIMQSETETHRGEVIMVCFKLISQHLSGTTEENNDKDLARIVSALDEEQTGFGK